ncbi:hypothetical protein [Marinobacterium arenosum]|uniref:hypothetical protein n=1 Tax=Marinobacterium arenosum TaxID=2862496 RepID=UPI001C946211|nr:hypothetical protein [Marinobacterium arenosum]MBY4677685.1 hypothetical protein [Marinobacterium arenosum]
MELLRRELAQLFSIAPAVDLRDELNGAIELTGLFARLAERAGHDVVIEGVRWLSLPGRALALRSQLDPVLEALLASRQVELAWSLACLFATGDACCDDWDWFALSDESRTAYCLRQAAGHPLADAYDHFLSMRHEPRHLQPDSYPVPALVIAGALHCLPLRPMPMLRILERLVRCGSLPAWQAFQQQAVRYRQAPVIARWRQVMAQSAYPFEINRAVINNSATLDSWLRRHSPQQLVDGFVELNREQWLLLVGRLTPELRQPVVAQVWQRFGPRIEL